MARGDRLERLDRNRAELEADYEQALRAALARTAAGEWGLFGHQDDRRVKARIAPVIDALAEMAEQIDAMRDTLGMEPFALHRQFLAARGKVASHAVGEPKQAQAWLERLGPG